MKLGICKVEGNQNRNESLHAYDADQRHTTLCGIDLRYVTLLSQDTDKMELSCFTCRDVANKSNANKARERPRI